MNPTDKELAERLREESRRLSGRSLDRGCPDSGIAANVADKAASRIEALSTENARKDQIIENLHREWAADRAENAELREKLAEAEKKLARCQWYWPEEDTSSECCADSPSEVVQSAYEWNTPVGNVVAVARGGIVDVVYCASLPPADDSDSDDDFWVEEASEEEARAKIKAEQDRRIIMEPRP